MAPSSIQVALTPRRRSPATSVVFLRLPCGQALACWRAAVPARHVGGRKALVDEHQLLRIEVELAFEPVLTLRQDVRAVLLGSVRGLLLEGQVTAIEEGPDRAGARVHASLSKEASLQLSNRAVGFGLDRRQQEVAMGVELGAGPASWPACRTLAAVAHTPEPLDRRRDADLKPSRCLARR
jgi:hypothetical protein